jgi:hypothetical protein
MVLAVSALLRVYPEALAETNKKGLSPLHIFSSINLESVDDWGYSYSSRQQISRSCVKSCDLLSTLVTAFPAAARLRDQSGCLPLHLLFTNVDCYGNKDIFLRDMSGIIIDAYPEGVAIQNNEGKIPLHCLLELSNSDSNLDVRKEFISARRMIASKMLHIDPTGTIANQADNAGNTTLHLAVRYCSSISQLLIDHCKADINKRNKKGETPLHYAIYNDGDQNYIEEGEGGIMVLLFRGASMDGYQEHLDYLEEIQELARRVRNIDHPGCVEFALCAFSAGKCTTDHPLRKVVAWALHRIMSYLLPYEYNIEALKVHKKARTEINKIPIDL